ncbi:MAG: thrombospondin type 3 repeat-containing protein, partial [Prosthecobacter sp.]|nr:thrombospondin type 3 repeat-containing protein [Prosthecobacter sp.]
MSRLFALFHRTAFWLLLFVGLPGADLIALDQNSNQQGDIWEVQYGALNLPALDDTDHDGFSNAMESVAGTNPLNPFSRPELEIIPGALGEVKVSWTSQQGKIYNLYGCPDLNTANWQLLSTVSGDGSELLEALATNGENRWFFRIQAADVDSDADGLSDWEEYQLGFDPMSSHTERNDTADLSRVTSSWSAPSTVTVGLLDGLMREDWPDKGVIAIRRTGGIQPLTINVTFTGSATRDTDYSTITGNQ